jgi:hypothetical protein
MVHMGCGNKFDGFNPNPFTHNPRPSTRKPKPETFHLKTKP